MNPTNHIIERVGTIPALADMAGVSCVTVYRWRRGEGGNLYKMVPQKYHSRVARRAAEKGIILNTSDFLPASDAVAA